MKHHNLCFFIFALITGSVTGQEDKNPEARLIQLNQPKPVRGWLDISPQNYPDLMPHYREVPEELNAVRLLLEAKEKLVEWDKMRQKLGEYKKGGKAWDNEYWNITLKNNETSINLIDQALKRPWLQIPVLLSPSDETTGLMVVMQASSLKSAQFLHYLENGDRAEALQILKDSYNLSKKSTLSDGGLIGWLVGLACYDVSFHLTNRLLQSSNLLPEEVQELELILKGLPSITERAQEAFRSETLIYMNFLGDLYRGHDKESLWGESLLSKKIVTRLLFQPNKTIKMHTDMMRYSIISAETPRWKRSDIPKPDSAELLNRDLTLWTNISPNAMGRMLFTMATPMVLKLVGKVEAHQLGVQIAKTLCALQRYHSRHKILPADLKTLIPDYMAAIPIDPFDGKPLRYSKEKRRLWSVGEDGNDEGGLVDVKPFTHFRKMKNEPTYLIRFDGK